MYHFCLHQYHVLGQHISIHTAWKEQEGRILMEALSHVVERVNPFNEALSMHLEGGQICVSHISFMLTIHLFVCDIVSDVKICYAVVLGSHG